MRVLEGVVSSGMGIATNNLGGVIALLRKRTGIAALLAGTLNLRLASPYFVQPDSRLTKAEYWGVEEVLLQRCRVAGFRCYIVRPESHERGKAHGPTGLEIASDRHLRTVLGLQDGAVLGVEVEGDAAWWNAGVAPDPH